MAVGVWKLIFLIDALKVKIESILNRKVHKDRSP